MPIFETLKFSEIYFQNEIKSKLVSAVKAGRIPHAQMFIAPEGAGALSLAVAYAQFVNCTDKQNDDSCGVCASCVKYNQLVHPDLHFTFPIHGSKENCNDFMNEFRTAFIENPNLSLNDWFSYIKAEGKKPNININECRNIFKKLSLKTYENEFKVLVMWLPEYLGNEGNTLLKLLEEPTVNTLFLLVTEKLELILPTIVSRTQLVKIKPYTQDEIVSYLIDNVSIEQETAKQIAMMSEGNINKAMVLSQELNNPLVDQFREWLLLCHQEQMPALFNFGNDLADKGKDFVKNFLNYSLQMVRATMLNQYISMENKLSEKENELTKKLSQIIHIENAQLMYKALNESIYEIERNGNLKLIIIHLSLKIKNSLKMGLITPNKNVKQI